MTKRTRSLLRVVLEQCGAEVRDAASAGEGFEILERNYSAPEHRTTNSSNKIPAAVEPRIFTVIHSPMCGQNILLDCFHTSVILEIGRQRE